METLRLLIAVPKIVQRLELIHFLHKGVFEDIHDSE